jgi:uncharacterized protein YbbC (DUF1343 family)
MPGLVRNGIEVFLENRAKELDGLRIGLLCNQASVDSQLRSSVDLLAARYGPHLTAIFTPQHGLWGEEQANMIETEHSRHRRLGIPVFSLYSETRTPTPRMLEQIDCLIVDLQDVGTRVYTFIWTLLACMQACQEAGKPLWVLDRPNPLGGETCEGPMLSAGLESFVGNSRVPLRHGLTLAELAHLFQARHTPQLQLTTVPMTGWHRQTLYADTGLAWIWPSPNMQRIETALVYPGQVLLEGTNLSEGRGTTLPFEVCGAPYLDGQAWCEALAPYAFPGVHLRPLRFRPVFDKWCGQSCGGLQIHVQQPTQVRSVTLTLALMHTAMQLAPGEFKFLPPPYEYEFDKLPIDILLGDIALREQLQRNELHDLATIDVGLQRNLLAWESERRKVMLYS